MLTSKSMMFDGHYIEDLIEGYTTLNVTGREMAEIEVSSADIANRDGAIFRNSRYKPRVLTIEFCLEGDDLGFNPDNTELINRLNRLNGILETEEEVQIIFRDEPDKYYMGIRDGRPSVTMALGVVKGTFEIYCSDPFKYSAEPVVVTPDFTEESGARTFVIDYEGTHKSYPKFKTQFYTQKTIKDNEDESGLDEGTTDTTSTGDEDEEIAGKGACGYVAFFDDEEHILQFGDPEATGETAQTATKRALINQNFQTLGSFPESVQQKWLNNSAIFPSATYNQRGEFEINQSYYSGQSTTTSGTLLSKAKGTNATYTLTYKASKRTASSVRFDISITGTFSATIPKAGVLTAYITIGDSEYAKRFKAGNVEWKKGKKVTVTHAFTVSDIEAYTDTIGYIYFRMEREGGKGTDGARWNIACTNALIPTYIENVVKSYYLTPDGSSMVPAVNNAYYGPSLTRTIDNTGYTDFTVDFHTKFCIGAGPNDVQQCGLIFVGVLTGTVSGGQLTNRKILGAGIIRKHQPGKTGTLDMMANGSYVQSGVKVDLSYYNKYFGNTKKGGATPNRHIIIQKSGKDMIFTMGGLKYTKKNVVPADAKAYQVVVSAMGYSGKPRIDWMGFYNVNFTPDKVDNVEKTIPFTTGDLLVADTATGDIFLNGVKRPDLGALGNDWEKMCLTPGMNQISTAFSDWCTDTAYRRCRSDDGYDSSETYYTKSGSTYTKATPTEAQYTANPSNYYILESCAPQFSIEYQEVYS